MLLEKVEVRSFRTLAHVDVNFTRGLNVIHGDNDAGKTTLMEAIRACLTLRASGSGKSHTRLRPRTGGDPEVCVTFSRAGARFTVRKRFGVRGTVHLNVRPASGVARDLSGDEAEHELRAVLGMKDEPSRRPSDLGILPILWVDQGTSGVLPDLKEGHGPAALGERLSELSGEAIGGENGERIFNVIEEAFERTFSSRGPKAGSDLQRATDSSAEARAHLQVVEARHRELENAAVQFDDKAVRLRSVQSSLPKLVAAVDAANQGLSKARDDEAERERASAQLVVATLTAAQASERHRRRMTDREAVVEAGRRLTSSQAAYVVSSDQVVAHDAGRAPVAAALAEALVAETHAGAAASAAQRDALRIEALRDVATLDEKIARGRGCDNDRLEAARRAMSEPIDETMLANIEELQRESDLASASLGASATTLEVRALERSALLLDGEQFDLTQGQQIARTIATSASLRIDDAVEIRIRPGGADLEQLRHRAFASQKALAGALERIGATSVKEARERAATRREWEQSRVLAVQLLAATAPEGLRALEEKRANLLEGIDLSTETTSPAEHDLVAARKSAVDATHLADDARRACEQVRQQLKALDAVRDRLQGDVRVAAEAVSGATQARERAEAVLAASVGGIGTDDVLEAAHAEAVATRGAVERRLAEMAMTLPTTAVAEAEERLRRAQSALDGARAEDERLSKESYRLEVDLQAADVVGLDDRIAAARVRLEDEEATLGRLTAQASATRVLFELLRDARAAARKRFLAPLAREIQPLLNVMYPGSRLDLDEHFAVTRLERAADGVHEFDALGGGSKEQLAILVRLAMARVLGAGEPLPVMLDDAIVFTSEARFARMSKVLLAAAAGLQLLVFTCHWDRYRELGPDCVIDLDQARARNVALPKHAA